jgi:hypothetical protein
MLFFSVFFDVFIQDSHFTVDELTTIKVKPRERAIAECAQIIPQE